MLIISIIVGVDCREVPLRWTRKMVHFKKMYTLINISASYELIDMGTQHAS